MLQHYKDKDQERLFLDIEANRNTDLESNGNWDGLLAELPQEEYWAELAYRKGYVTGITQHYDQKYHISIEEF